MEIFQALQRDFQGAMAKRVISRPHEVEGIAIAAGAQASRLQVRQESNPARLVYIVALLEAQVTSVTALIDVDYFIAGVRNWP